MKIKKSDLHQIKDLDDLLYDLIEKYYPDYEDDSFDSLDIVTQTFTLIVDLDGQVNNGGIIQFMDNRTGNRFHETVAAAKRINSGELVEILTRAAEQFPNGQIPKDWDERRSLYEQLCEKYITYRTFDKLNAEEKKIVLENREKFGDTTPLDQCSFEEKSSWVETWEELDSLYYDHSNFITQNLINYLKNNATFAE